MYVGIFRSRSAGNQDFMFFEQVGHVVGVELCNGSRPIRMLLIVFVTVTGGKIIERRCYERAGRGIYRIIACETEGRNGRGARRGDGFLRSEDRNFWTDRYLFHYTLASFLPLRLSSK